MNAKGIKGIGSNYDKPLQAETPRITQILSRPQPVYSPGQSQQEQIIQERLSREFDINLMTTSPSVVYKVEKTNGESIEVHNPTNLPDISQIKIISEPYIKATILLPDEYLGSVMKLCNERRGIQKDLTYVGNRAMLIFSLPLAEVVLGRSL